MLNIGGVIGLFRPTNSEETALGTDLKLVDADGDVLSVDEGVNTHSSDPLNTDMVEDCPPHNDKSTGHTRYGRSR